MSAIKLTLKLMMSVVALLGIATISSAEQGRQVSSVLRADLKERHIADLIRAAYGADAFHEDLCDPERYRLNMVLWQIYGGRVAGMPLIFDGSPTQSLLRCLPKSAVLYEELNKLSECQKAMFLRDATDYLQVTATDWLSTRSLAVTQPLYAALYRLYSEDDWNGFTVAMKSAWESDLSEDVITFAGCVPRRYMRQAEEFLESLKDNDAAGSELARLVYCLFRIRTQVGKCESSGTVD